MTASLTSSPAAASNGASASDPASVDGGYPRPHHWTREEYYAIAETGVFEGRRVELIDGNIVDMSPHGKKHFMAIGLAQLAMQRVFGPTYWIRVQGPLRNGQNEPEPDIAVVEGSPRDFGDHPTTALLVVEIADTSLAFDRGHKAHLYASAGVEDYWVVNLNDNNLDIFRSPTPDPAAPFGHRYAERRTLGKDDAIAALAKAGTSINVADMLP